MCCRCLVPITQIWSGLFRREEKCIIRNEQCGKVMQKWVSSCDFYGIHELRTLAIVCMLSTIWQIVHCHVKARPDRDVSISKWLCLTSICGLINWSHWCHLLKTAYLSGNIQWLFRWTLPINSDSGGDTPLLCFISLKLCLHANIECIGPSELYGKTSRLHPSVKNGTKPDPVIRSWKALAPKTATVSHFVMYLLVLHCFPSDLHGFGSMTPSHGIMNLGVNQSIVGCSKCLLMEDAPLYLNCKTCHKSVMGLIHGIANGLDWTPGQCPLVRVINSLWCQFSMHERS